MYNSDRKLMKIDICGSKLEVEYRKKELWGGVIPWLIIYRNFVEIVLKDDSLITNYMLDSIEFYRMLPLVVLSPYNVKFTVAK
jgi:hypothetical protein